MFEKTATVNRWPKSDWVCHLVSQLIGKAQHAYVQMDVADASDYDLLKEAILNAYQVTPEQYRCEFHSARKEYSETYAQFGVRLNANMERWLRSRNALDDAAKIRQVILMEQALTDIPRELEVWLHECELGAEDLQSFMKQADIFVAAHEVEQINIGGNAQRKTEENRERKLSDRTFRVKHMLSQV